jgi:hypothetical protein
VTVEVPAGAHVSMHDLGHWTVEEQTSHLTGEDLVLEVIDEIDRLAGRPTSVDRCMAALAAFLQAPDEARRDELRAAYYAIPTHERIYILGDMDEKDGPVRVLMTPAGGDLDGYTVTAEDHASAFEYFAEWNRDREWAEERRPAVEVPQTTYVEGWPAKPPGLLALRAEFPRPLPYRGRHYLSVHHAFWAASVGDEGRVNEVLAGRTPYAVKLKRSRSGSARTGPNDDSPS